ncbi:FmdB family transcriptional regulator [candidate division KSB3 bacterium]|uniref:FmdB family transcriptional regulator n=1 Tax=candidate division KSB3 bacterium TaxID=2044937 RepID=A0A2G6KCY1_9BACT|nr:MAG: FmdB family transcriptional regulator [candidate division KSB3 bacterium]
MPTYEYQCTSCGHLFELFQMMTDEPIKLCPECQHEVRRLLGKGAGFIMKGGGSHPTASCCGQSHNQSHNHEGGQRCCGREERCDRPPCHA